MYPGIALSLVFSDEATGHFTQTVTASIQTLDSKLTSPFAFYFTKCVIWYTHKKSATQPCPVVFIGSMRQKQGIFWCLELIASTDGSCSWTMTHFLLGIYVNYVHPS